MDQVKVKELRKLLDEVMYAPTKEAGKAPLKRIEFMIASAGGSVDPYLVGKLREATSYAKEASGMVHNKEHWISCAEQSWYVFESGITKQLSKD